jgi:hypothetical protein
LKHRKVLCISTRYELRLRRFKPTKSENARPSFHLALRDSVLSQQRGELPAKRGSPRRYLPSFLHTALKLSPGNEASDAKSGPLSLDADNRSKAAAGFHCLHGTK